MRERTSSIPSSEILWAIASYLLELSRTVRDRDKVPFLLGAKFEKTVSVMKQSACGWDSPRARH